MPSNHSSLFLSPYKNLQQMKRKVSHEVQTFLDATQAMSPEKYDSILEIRDIFHESHPEAEEKIMYGGIVFQLNSELIGGIFTSKKHITIEFSNGHQMQDPDGWLEGKGKYRRHIKIHQKEDIQSKNVSFYIKQAV